MAFNAQYEDLVADYGTASIVLAKLYSLFSSESRKVAGTLDPFDPSSSAVHEKSRIKHIVTINGTTATLRTSFGSVESNLASGSELSSLTEQDSDPSDDGDYIRDPNERKLRPRHNIKQSKLPFSPKKLRSRRIQMQVVSDSGDDLGGYGQSDAEEEPIRTRRSTRAKKHTRLNLDDDAEGIESIDDETYSEGLDNKLAKADAGKRRKQRRPAMSRPAYGHFRDIDDLEFDPYGEESTEPLRAHRDACEKCHKGPAHELLKAMRKSKRSRKKRSPDADADLEGGEEERIQNMGGWVRW